MNHVKTIRNWGKTFEYSPQTVYYPGSEEDIIRTVQTCNQAQHKVRAMGSRHSYTPLISSEGAALSLDNFKGIEEFNYDEMTVTVRGGTSMAELEKALFANELSLYNLGDINEQSIAGLIATGSHGTGLSLGISSTQVVWMQIITADGAVLECSETQHPEIFKAAQVSLGTLGVVSRVKLKVLPKYHMHQERTLVDFDEALNHLLDSFKNNRNYELFWFPYTDYVFEKKHNLVSEIEPPKKFKKLFNDYVLENGVLWLLSEMSRKVPNFYRKHANTLLKKLNVDFQGILPSVECYATVRLVNNREMEYAIPITQAIETIQEIRHLLNHHNCHVSFPIEVRSVAADDIYLSPTNRQDTVWIAVHAYTKDAYESVFKEAEKIFLAHQGRPHWGKMHWLSQEDIKRLYPCLPQFNEIRKKLDPQGLFLNTYLKGLLGA